MKKIFALALMLQQVLLYTQWQQIATIGTNDLRSVRFFNEYTGIIAGLGGIWRSTNSGINRVNVSTESNLNSISFFDLDNGYAVGESGKVFRTFDNGLNWFHQDAGITNNALYGSSFYSISRFHTVGTGGIILRTGNGSSPWNFQNSTGPDFYSIVMNGNGEGCCIGSLNTERCVMHYPIDSTMYLPSYTFCDAHACEIFNNINDSTLKSSLISKNLNILKFNSELDAYISIEKSNYLRGENITLNIQFKNITGKPLVVKNFNSNFVYSNFRIQNAAGEFARFMGGCGISLNNKYDTLKVDEERNFGVSLLDDWGELIDERISPGSIPGILEPSIYTIVFNAEMNNTVVNSNTLTFEITNPIDNELAAFDMLKEIYIIKTQGYYVDKIKKLSDFIHIYSESVYSDQAFRCMMDLELHDNTNENTVDDCKWFIAKKPNSPVVYYAIKGIIYMYEKKLKDRDGLKIYLKEITTGFPNTKVFALAQKTLNEKFK